MPIEVWRSDDVPPLVDPSADTDEQEGPFATGTARIGFTDATATRTSD